MENPNKSRRLVRANVVDDPDLFETLVAEVEPKSDIAEQQNGPIVQRTIIGAVTFHAGWEKFYRLWENIDKLGVAPVHAHSNEGVRYIPVRGLQVDHDVYGNFSWLHVSADRSEISLILLESFEGKLDSYFSKVEDRNKRISDSIRRWDEGLITRNEVRAFNGLPHREEPFFNEPLGVDACNEMRPLYLDSPTGYLMRTNMIV